MPSRSELSAELPGRRRESTDARGVLSTIASGMFLAGCLLICGLCAGSLYYFQPDVRDEPGAVDPLMAEMLDVEVPPQFEPRGVVEWNVAFVMSLRGAYFETPDTETEGMLMFVEVQSLSMDEPDVRAHVRQALREKGGGVVELELVGEAEQRDLDVRGEPVSFRFETRIDPVSELTYRVIEGIVSGKQGQVLIGLKARDEHWDDAVAIEMIESIR